MLEGTFQADLPPGVLKNLQSFMNIPEVKLFVPFYKTVTNIFLESSKRNPTTAFLMPSVRRDLKGSKWSSKETISSSKNINNIILYVSIHASTLMELLMDLVIL